MKSLGTFGRAAEPKKKKSLLKECSRENRRMGLETVSMIFKRVLLNKETEGGAVAGKDTLYLIQDQEKFLFHFILL